MKSTQTLLALGLVCCITSASAQAPVHGQRTDVFYLGLDVGSSKFEATSSVALIDGGQQSGNDTGYKLRLGYLFSRFFAMEVGYVDFGRFTARRVMAFCQGPLPGPCPYDLEASTHGFLFNIVGSWPFTDRWSGDVRLGAFHSEASTLERPSDGSVPGSRRSEENTALQYGAGLSYHIHPRASVSLDWAQFDQIGLGLGLSGGPAFFDVGSSSLLSLGVTYRF